MKNSSIAMVCNSTGPVDAAWGAQWGLTDLDWSGGMNVWAAPSPMIAEEFMVANCDAINAASNGQTACWVYRNGVKALPWHASVRRLLENQATWGLFMPIAGCMPTPGTYVCGPNASQNLYHDFEETPFPHSFKCGVGIECGEYVFNHRNASLRDFFVGDYFFPQPFPKSVTGYYVDDEWEASGPTEMDKDAVEKMGMTPADVTAMIAAWSANVQAYRDALVAAELFEWYLLDGGQQTARGQNQTCGQCTCQSFLEAQCSVNASAQSGTLFYGYSRSVHTQPWPLPTPDQDLAMFLLARGPYAFFGYGWSGCISASHPFTRPPSIEREYGAPLNNCSQTAPGSGVWTRNFTHADVAIDCKSFEATFSMK